MCQIHGHTEQPRQLREDALAIEAAEGRDMAVEQSHPAPHHQDGCVEEWPRAR